MSESKKVKTVYKKAPSKKGASKIQSEKDTENNPLLKIESNSIFRIEVGNMFEDQWILINPEYENFDPGDKSTLDASRLDQSSEFLVILRYYEYVITAKFTLSYIFPLWSNGEKTGDMTFKDIFDAIDHRLLMELQLRTPSFDTINVLEISHLYKIRYITESMIEAGRVAKNKKEQ
jgi:hypothetical protein